MSYPRCNAIPNSCPPHGGQAAHRGEHPEPVLAQQQREHHLHGRPWSCPQHRGDEQAGKPVEAERGGPQRTGEPHHDGEHRREQGADRDQAAGGAVVAVLGPLLDQGLVQAQDGENDQNLVQGDRRRELPELRRAEQVGANGRDEGGADDLQRPDHDVAGRGRTGRRGHRPSASPRVQGPVPRSLTSSGRHRPTQLAVDRVKHGPAGRGGELAGEQPREPVDAADRASASGSWWSRPSHGGLLWRSPSQPIHHRSDGTCAPAHPGTRSGLFRTDPTKVSSARPSSAARTRRGRDGRWATSTTACACSRAST